MAQYAGQEPTGEAFRPEWIDFENGIRVGNIEPHERITQILKYHLTRRFSTPFITDRWGRGVYWQWICWLPKANKQAKPISHSTNFGCAKLFISIDREQSIFQAGLQIERGYVKRPPKAPGEIMEHDWDWHLLISGCRGETNLGHELHRLVNREDFRIEIGDWDHSLSLDKKNYTGVAQVLTALQNTPDDRWGGFQLYYPMSRAEVESCDGMQLVEAVKGIFTEVIPAMNACMQVRLESDQEFPAFIGKA